MIAWLLALCLVCSLSACSGNQKIASAADAASDTQGIASETEQIEVDSDSDESDTQNSSSGTKQSETSADSDETEPDELSALYGSIDGDLYTNEYFGLEVKRPEGWFFDAGADCKGQ